MWNLGILGSKILYVVQNPICVIFSLIFSLIVRQTQHYPCGKSTIIILDLGDLYSVGAVVTQGAPGAAGITRILRDLKATKAQL